MNVPGIVLAAVTMTIGPPLVSDARSTQSRPPVGIEASLETPDRAASAGLAVLSPALALSSPEATTVVSPYPAPIELVIEVRDLAGVPQRIMRDTKAEVEHTFLAVGVRIRWADLGRTPRDELAPLRLFVVGSPPRRVLSDDNPLAATLGVAPASGDWAQVFYGRVAAAVARRTVSIGVVLAHVMAHELGHVLLPPNSHSAVGVMREAVDLTHPTLRRFTDEQARLIRAALTSGRRYAWSCSQ